MFLFSQFCYSFSQYCYSFSQFCYPFSRYCYPFSLSPFFHFPVYISNTVYLSLFFSSFLSFLNFGLATRSLSIYLVMKGILLPNHKIGTVRKNLDATWKADFYDKSQSPHCQNRQKSSHAPQKNIRRKFFVSAKFISYLIFKDEIDYFLSSAEIREVQEGGNNKFKLRTRDCN